MLKLAEAEQVFSRLGEQQMGHAPPAQTRIAACASRNRIVVEAKRAFDDQLNSR